jgi:hypothetical protein
MYSEQMKQKCGRNVGREGGKKEGSAEGRKEGFDGFLWLNIFVVSL